MLSKEAKTVLYHLYKEYRVNRDNDISRRKSKEFGSPDSVHASLFPDLPMEDFEDILRELVANGFLENHYSSGSLYECTLSDSAIIKMENLNMKRFISVTDFIAKFIP